METILLHRLYILILSALFLYTPQLLLAQSGGIKGKIISKTDNQPLPFVKIDIILDGMFLQGTQTDFDGVYSIKNIPIDTVDVTISFAGYQTKIIENIVIIENQMTNLNISLQEGENALGADAITEHVNYDEAKTSSPTSKRSRAKADIGYDKPLSTSEAAPATAVLTKDRSTSKMDRYEAKNLELTTATSRSKSSKKRRRTSMETSEIAASSMDLGIAVLPEPAPILPGQLTAGELHDFSKWGLWQNIAGETLKEWQEHWQMQPTERYLVQLMTENGQPIVDQEVFLQDKKGEVFWTSRTDNTGKAELWAHLFDIKTTAKKEKLMITTTYNGKVYRQKKAKTFQKGNNTIRIPMACDQVAWADIAFVVDATGSMGDEIKYLKVELNDVIQKIKAQQKGLTLNIGSVFYRDELEEYVTKKSDFSTDPKQTVDFIRQQKAVGGGDVPEAVHSALEVAVRALEWSDNATARLLFLVLDAPPHHDPEVLKSLQQVTQEAAKKGIRIIPVTASGIDKSTEYLMRSMALATNGTYVFLTDDSGIGNPHIKPTTDKYKVETFNELLIRLVNQYTEMPDCSEKVVLTEMQKTAFSAEISPLLNYYPNPTVGLVTIAVFEPMPALYVTDLTGKLLQRFTNVEKGTIKLDLSDYPSGIYLLRYPKGENSWLTGKIVVTR